jgi:ankyrin repeat protein
MSDERSWLPMHFAIALYIQNEISADDVHMLHTSDPIAMYRLSEEEVSEEEIALIGCTPAHFLCMQKEPNMAMVRYFTLRDPKAFLLCDQSGRCVLHLVAQYSESVELLQIMLQIDHSMTKSIFEDDNRYDAYPLGLLCQRSKFPTFLEMVTCLIEVDSSVEVIYNGIVKYMESSDDAGHRGDEMVVLLTMLLNAKLDVTKYKDSNIFHRASLYLRGESGVAVLSLFLTKNNNGLKVVDSIGLLPIQYAATYSSIDVLKLLHDAHPESLYSSTSLGENLLHLVFYALPNDITDTREKVQYLCNKCPAFIHQKNNVGRTPLQLHLIEGDKLDMKAVVYLCNIDATVVRDKCTPPNDDDFKSGKLPLHLLIVCKSLRNELSDEGDCLRLLLRLYPGSAGIKDDHLFTPYDLAVMDNLSPYFLRLLLSNDPAIDPVRRHYLNYEARRNGMFLAFRALSGNIKATIWAKIRNEGKDLLMRVISYL